MEIFSLLFLLLLSLRAETITIVADEWCPYNCNSKDSKNGYIIEIAETIFNKHGYEVKYISGVSWTESIKQVRKGSFNAVVGAFKSDTPDFIFPKEELGKSKSIMLVSSKSNWKFTDDKSLNKVTIGYIDGYTYDGGAIDTYIQNNINNPQKVQVLSGNNALVYNIKKLLYNRIDLIIEDELVLNSYLRKENNIDNFNGKMFKNKVKKSVINYYHELKDKNGDPFKIAYEFESDNVYISFSPNHKNSKKYAQMLSDGLVKIRNNGELKVILDRYGIKDWK